MFTNKNISVGTKNEQAWYWQREWEGKDVPGQHGEMTDMIFTFLITIDFSAEEQFGQNQNLFKYSRSNVISVLFETLKVYFQ